MNMNTDKLLSISSSHILVLILEALAIYVILRLLRKYSPLLPKKEKFRKLLKQRIHLFEIIVWLLFFIHLINNLYSVPKIIIQSIVAGIVLGFLWFYFKDYLVGVIFRINYNIEVDDFVTINNISGRVKNFKSKYIEIETSNGEIFFINYSDVNKSVISKKLDTEQSAVFSFTIKILSDNYTQNKISEIKKYALTFPSVSTQRAPNVRVTQNNGEYIELKISFVSLDEERNDIVMEAIREKFDEQ